MKAWVRKALKRIPRSPMTRADKLRWRRVEELLHKPGFQSRWGELRRHSDRPDRKGIPISPASDPAYGKFCADYGISGMAKDIPVLVLSLMVIRENSYYWCDRCERELCGRCLRGVSSRTYCPFCSKLMSGPRRELVFPITERTTLRDIKQHWSIAKERLGAISKDKPKHRMMSDVKWEWLQLWDKSVGVFSSTKKRLAHIVEVSRKRHPEYWEKLVMQYEVRSGLEPKYRESTRKDYFERDSGYSDAEQVVRAALSRMKERRP